MSVYIVSDLHFGHKNLCQALRHMTPEECDALIIKNWNQTVKKKDKVFILGDITMEKPNLIKEYLPKLNGFKHIVLGNHDYKSAKTILDIADCKVSGPIQYKGFFLTHIPIHPSQLDFCRGNIHGHIHNKGIIDGFEYNPIQNLGPGYYNANIEFHDYKPVNFEKILQYFEKNNIGSNNNA